MPSKSRRNITHNLASRAGRAALEDAIEDEDEFDQRLMRGASPGSRANNRPRSFLTSAPRDEGDWSGSEAQAVDLSNLLSMFAHADGALVKEVFAGCDNDFERALACLSEMTSGSGNNHAPHPPTTAPPVNAESSSATAAAAAEDEGSAPRTCWDDLPGDCIDLILSSLPARDVACAAPTNRDFARRVHLGAINAKVLTIPLGLSLNSIMGMVSGHPNAHTVSLARWSAEGPLTERDLTALITTLNLASRSSRRNTPVESISFKGWSWLNNGHIMLICATMQHLKELDLTDCSGVSDAALIEISKYKRLEKDEDEDEEEDEEGAAPFALLPPSSSPPAATLGPIASSSIDEGGRREISAAGASDDEAEEDEELQFEMDASEPSPKLKGSERPALKPQPSSKGKPPRVPPSVTLSYGLPFSPAFGAKGPFSPAFGAKGIRRREEESEEARFESLALLAATSPPPLSSSWMAAVSMASQQTSADAAASTALGSSTSPPSSSMMFKRTSSQSSGATNPNHKIGSPVYPGGVMMNDPPGSSFMILGSSLGATAGGASSASPFLGSSPPSTSTPVGSWQARGLSTSQRGGVGGGGGMVVGSPGWIGAWDRRNSGGGGGGGGGVSHTMGGGSPLGTSPLQPSILSSMTKVPKLSTATGLGLRSLVIAGCSQITGEGVRKFLDSPLVKSSLEALDISRCYKMSRQALSIPPASCLKVLKCSGCGNLHEVVIQLPPTCPLTELHLNNCKSLTKLHVVASNLKLLHVGGCKVLTGISLKCPQLATLLANLTFRWEVINPEQWSCPRLQHVNLFGARHLDTASLSVILDQCPGIKHLNLNGCNTITTIDLPAEACRELKTLDVSACKGLCLLRLQGAEQLREVQAKACPRLVEAQVDARGLVKMDVSHCPVLSTLSIPALVLQRPQDMWAVGADAVGGRRLGLPDGLVLTRVVISRWLAERNFNEDVMLRIRLLKEAIAAELTTKAAEKRRG